MRRELTPSDDLAARLSSAEAELTEAFEAGAPGLELARRRALLFDGVLSELFEAADLPGGYSLVALGGYGRQELAPHSDIDLLILHPEARGQDVASVAERIFYPLWDAGLTVGNAVRTVSEAIDVAAESLETQTTQLDSRLVAGDRNLLEQLRDKLARQVGRQRGKRFLEALRQELAKRHDEFGQSAYLLEPHIKEGLGGLRDIQAIGWVGKALYDASDLQELAATPELPEDDAAELASAYENLWTVRTYLHLRSARQNDRLTFDRQIELAKRLGFEADQDSLAAERFMTHVFDHMGQVERVSAVFWERQSSKFARRGKSERSLGGGIVARNGHVDLVDDVVVTDKPEVILALFAAGVRENLPVASEAIETIQVVLPKLEQPTWDDSTRKALVDLLAEGSRALPALELLTQMGVFSYFIPEWEQVRSLVQFDAYHIYTVDLHALHTVAELGRIRSGRYEETEPVATRMAQETDRWDMLLIAALLHDIGKGGGHGHAERGGQMARAIADRMGLPEQTSQEVEFLVKNHLLLYDTATRRDLNDERVIVAVAQELPRPELLGPLYLLTSADAVATGPKAWSPWKSALMAELVVKIQHVQEQGVYAGGDAKRRLIDTKRDVMRKLAARYSARRIDTFLESIPVAYMLAHDPVDICRHFELMEGEHTEDLRVAVRQAQRPGLYEYTLVTKDQPELFSTVAGALALNGVSINSAETYVRSTGQALMVFNVAHVFDEAIDDEKWDRVRGAISRALDGRLALSWRLAERAQQYRDNRHLARAKPPRVVVDNEGSDFFTLIEVYAQDRVGLLFTIATALDELKLDIHQTRISTHGDEAADIFYVLDRGGQKATDPGHIKEIQRAVAYALAPPK